MDASPLCHVGVAKVLLSVKPIDDDSNYALLSTKRRSVNPQEGIVSSKGSPTFRPIVLAARNGHIELSQLFTKGFERDGRVGRFQRDEALDTLWHVASAGDDTMLRFLVKNVAFNLWAKDSDGKNALMHAASGSHEAVVRFLVESSNPDVNAQDALGRTAFHGRLKKDTRG